MKSSQEFSICYKDAMSLCYKPYQSSNFIEELEIQFSDGLTVLSGETGSGKSIIIDAIGQLIGMRASSDFVRHGEKGCHRRYI